jgi:6-pyruvoyl-tetrahydropterin synthase
MYQITTGIYVHFAHHLRGHAGPCISLHGHTWQFVVTLGAVELDAGGFVVDFDHVHEAVLVPVHLLLDHALAVGAETYQENQAALATLGDRLVGSRCETIGDRGAAPATHDGLIGGARNELPGGIKVAVFPFSPTSERLAEWLFSVAEARLADDRVHVTRARVFEALHPVESVAEFSRPG